MDLEDSPFLMDEVDVGGLPLVVEDIVGQLPHVLLGQRKSRKREVVQLHLQQLQRAHVVPQFYLSLQQFATDASAQVEQDVGEGAAEVQLHQRRAQYPAILSNLLPPYQKYISAFLCVLGDHGAFILRDLISTGRAIFDCLLQHIPHQGSDCFICLLALT